jgi:hypothetical protein
MPSIRLLRFLPVLAVLVLLGTPATALADCIEPPRIEEAARSAEIVFVGTVTSTSNRDSWASVEVEEIWRGPDQPANVLVKGGPGGISATSVDRTFQAGAKYLFFPYVDGETLVDNSCTSTTPWSEDLLALRPAEARPPLGATEGASGFDFGAIVAPLGVALVVAAVLLLVGLAARGRQSG